nr:MAG TPA: Portal [Caudoviricetes sp.]
MNRHEQNRREIEYLERYFTGDQPILKRIKQIRPDVNNQIVINNAYSIVRNANGYFLGEPIKYASKDAQCRDEVEILNNMMDGIDKACGDTQIGEWQSICGTAYRLIYVGEDAISEDEEIAPFEIPVLNPKYTAVIYSTEAGNKPILALTYSDILDTNGNSIGRTYTVYDKSYQYVYKTKGVNTQIKIGDLQEGYPKFHLLDEIPIIEYPNNQWRLGDFETVITILDGLNKLQSDRINSVEQLVNSILVFINCELKEASENLDGKSDLDKLKEQLAISITSKQNQQADIKFVNSQVNQDEAETLAQTLIDYVYAVTGIPDRKTRSNGGGDTGDAVYLRDGWASLEVVARTKERYFRRSEKQMLNIICKVLKIFRNMDLKPMHIEPTFVRNRTNNLLNKAQAMAILKELKFIDPIDIVTLGGISDNPIDLVKRGLDYYKQQEEKLSEKNQSGDQKETAPTSEVSTLQQVTREA